MNLKVVGNEEFRMNEIEIHVICCSTAKKISNSEQGILNDEVS